ncbi:MAG: ZIP family metal transporter [Actinobacteria bacterium]|nr:ZIP family metal transporter [Actinomycetota bacterium]
MKAVAVFAFALATAAATGLGAVPFARHKALTRRWIGIATALAGGFMLGASIGLLHEGWLRNATRTLVGAGVGILFIVVTRHLLDGRRESHIGALRGTNARRAIVIMAVMTIHSFTEGAAIGVAFVEEGSFGLLIAVAIAVHNIPEGLAISATLVPSGVSPLRAAAWSILSSLPQPLMAVPAYLAVRVARDLLPAGLGFAAGAMLWMVATQLIPEARRDTSVRSLSIAVIAAAAVMVALQAAIA